MTDDRYTGRPDPAAAPDKTPRALERSSRWPGLVWAVPVAALMVVVYLGLQAYAKRGVDVVVTFGTSGGARAGDTPVVYKGVTIGHVVKIEVSHDVRNVDMTLRLEPRAKSALRIGAKFWLIGATPSLTDLSSLKAAVSGVSIGASPGTGAPADHFVGLDVPPPQPPDIPGTLYRLESPQLGSIRVGSGVYYRGLEVGRVTSVSLSGPKTFALGVFVEAPHDRLVHANSQFSPTRPLTVSVSGGEVSGELGPGNSVLAGGVQFDDPDPAEKAQSAAGTLFTLNRSEAEARDPSTGAQVMYQAIFPEAAAVPAVGAPVQLSGIRIGRVLTRKLSLRPGALAPFTQVTLEIEPLKLNLDGPGSQGDWRATTDAALAGLIRGGYRLRMGQTPPLIGPLALTLEAAQGARPAAIRYGGAAPELPTASSGDLAAITDRTVALLDKLNGLPIKDIGMDVRAITGRLRQLVSSPKLTDSLDHLDSTLAQIDQTTAQVRPEIAPLIAKLNLAADQLQGLSASATAVLGGQGASQDANLTDALRQLTDAARSIKSLADYLGRHPEAIIQGKVKAR